MSEEKKQYEISFLTRTEADKQVILKTLADISAEQITEGRFSEIRLAYPIKKQTVAYFGSIVFDALPGEVTKLDNILRFEEGILRFLFVTPPARKPVSRFAQKPTIEGEAVVSEEVKTEEAESIPEKEEKEKVDEVALDEKLEEILTDK
jgi:ribosomal protein S6